MAVDEENVDFRKIAQKWRKKWASEKVLQVEADNRKKYYIAIVYPYMSGLLHLGHLFTYTNSEILARYKRMRGFNVLVKFGFHCTGTPIVAAAQRVKEKEPTQLETLRKMGISEKDLPKFSDPEYWCEYFPKETLIDLKKMGFAIDERYTFRTTFLNPPYDAMVRWQFNKLKEKGYVKKGKHPVVWCPKDNLPVGDHDRSEGEGETPKDFIWVKFRMKNSDLILMAGTTRPDALLGQTNLWIDPKAEYSIVEVGKEKWVVGNDAIKKIEQQYAKPKLVGKLKAAELMGKWARGPLVDYDLYILPASFIDAKVGSGIVYSALEDPVDLVELQRLQTNPDTLRKYGLDTGVVSKLKPISIISIPEMGDDLGQEMINKYGIKSAKDKEKLEEAKGELNRAVFRKGVMKKNCGKYAGMTSPAAQAAIKKDLHEAREIAMFYELTGKVVCRCLTECVVKIVEDQWFIEYNDPEWKKLAHKCLGKMQIHPEILRKQFEYVIDWLDHWACTREYGLGTKLPWDQKWVIESLSDSTIQMAYGTISKYLQNPSDYGFSTHKLNDEFFDYVYLGRGDPAKVEKSTGIQRKLVEKMRSDFEYWYPFDFRNSAKDLLQNHLTFCLFNHAAIFQEKHWPRTFLINGRIMVNNQKMSKSKGNFFTMRELYTKHGPDIVRLTAAMAGEGADDANYDMKFHEVAKRKLSELHSFIIENYNKGRTETSPVDEWFESKVNSAIKKTTEAMEGLMFKSAIQYSLSDMARYLKIYLRRTGNKPNKRVISLFCQSLIKMLTPIVPHFSEEVWEAIGEKGLISSSQWPTYEEEKIDKEAEAAEQLVTDILSDFSKVLELAKIEKPKEVMLLVAPKWKYELVSILKEELKKTRDQRALINTCLTEKDLKPHGEDVAKIVQGALKDPSKLPETTITREKEIEAYESAKAEIEKEYRAKVSIDDAEKSKEPKARQAMPGKPAIIVK
ncbi:leucine--tRNA ligase [Candidatus Woesearchaeota archaeon]|nr:leucine--tRNA ligase [Candidatus Woesearchaeota archaeon]